MQSEQKKILVVDDEPDILAFLQALLEQAGYAVATTDKGEHVEKLHDGDLPELILFSFRSLVLNWLLMRREGMSLALKHS